jgi:outer membrane lipoprotein-sorting protein
MTKRTLTAIAILPTLFLGACASDPPQPGTKGEQLQDLQDDYKDRAITPDEYEEQKEEILDD